MKPHENPFRTGQIESLPFSDSQFVTTVTQTLLREGLRGAIVGPHGSGKTTVLEEIAKLLRRNSIETALLFLSEESDRIARRAAIARVRALNPEAVLLVDGYEQLSPAGRLLLLKHSLQLRGLIVSCHRPCLLKTIYRTHTSLPLLRALVQRLDPHPAPSDQLLAELFQRFEGNLREVFRGLYDGYALLTEASTRHRKSLSVSDSW